MSGVPIIQNTRIDVARVLSILLSKQGGWQAVEDSYPGMIPKDAHSEIERYGKEINYKPGP